MQGADGDIRLLLPDGHSISLSTEAAARTALLLTRAAMRAGKARRMPRTLARAQLANEVITVDFRSHARHS